MSKQKRFKFADDRKTDARRRREWKQKCREYAEFLKEDYDWDFAFIINLLVFKLERTKKCIVKNQIISKADEVGEEIQEVIDLFNRYHDHDYIKDAFKDFYKEHGRPKMVTIPPTKEEALKNPNLGGRLEFHHRGKPLPKEFQEKQRCLYEEAEHAKKADLDKAFKLMADRIEGWWD